MVVPKAKRSKEPAGNGDSLPTSRDKILDAAVQVAIRDGILAMTLDAVAREAGVSKGGLLYHFQTKDDLIAGMLDYFTEKVGCALEQRMAADEKREGRFFRAIVQMVFQPSPGADVPGPPFSVLARFMATMLAASLNNPRLLDVARENIRRLRERLLAEGPNGLRQVALWPAVYGLLLWQHLGILSFDDPVHRLIVDELLTLAEGPKSSVPGE
jgi:AcrR family transcriptional regulator